MVKLKFRDMKARKNFETDKFKIETRGSRRFAVAKAPSGAKAMRIVAKDFKA